MAVTQINPTNSKPKTSKLAKFATGLGLATDIASLGSKLPTGKKKPFQSVLDEMMV